MSIARISEFQAKPVLTDHLREFLISILPIIRSSQGCESVQMYQSQEDPTRFTVVEVWESIEAHRASVKNIPPEKLAEVQPLLGSAPAGNYHDLVSTM